MTLRQAATRGRLPRTARTSTCRPDPLGGRRPQVAAVRDVYPTLDAQWYAAVDDVSMLLSYLRPIELPRPELPRSSPGVPSPCRPVPLVALVTATTQLPVFRGLDPDVQRTSRAGGPAALGYWFCHQSRVPVQDRTGQARELAREDYVSSTAPRP